MTNITWTSTINIEDELERDDIWVALHDTSIEIGFIDSGGAYCSKFLSFIDSVELANALRIQRERLRRGMRCDL